MNERLTLYTEKQHRNHTSPESSPDSGLFLSHSPFSCSCKKDPHSLSCVLNRSVQAKGRENTSQNKEDATMTLKHEIPIDEDELIELTRKVIKTITDNPKLANLSLPIAELQDSLDSILKAREEEAVIREAQKHVKEQLQAAWEKVYSAQRKMRAYNREHGIRDSNIPLVGSDRAGLADRVFSPLADQSDILQVQKKDKS